MSVLLKNINVELISILTDKVKPANRQAVIFKSGNQYEIAAKVTKADTEKGLLYVTIMKANIPDTDDETTTAEDVQQAAHDFLKKGKIKCSDVNHDEKVLKSVFVVQSFINKDTGDWEGVLDISGSEYLMKKAEDDLITGVSIMATATKVVSKSFNEKLTLRNMWTYTDAISESIREIMNDEKIKDKKKAISKEIDDFKTVILANLTPTVKKSEGGFFSNLVNKLWKNETLDEGEKDGQENEGNRDNSEMEEVEMKDEEMKDGELIAKLEKAGYTVEKKQKEKKPEKDPEESEIEKSLKAENETLKTDFAALKKSVERLQGERDTNGDGDSEDDIETLMADPDKFAKMEKENPEKLRKMQDKYLA